MLILLPKDKKKLLDSKLKWVPDLKYLGIFLSEDMNNSEDVEIIPWHVQQL